MTNRTFRRNEKRKQLLIMIKEVMLSSMCYKKGNSLLTINRSQIINLTFNNRKKIMIKIKTMKAKAITYLLSLGLAVCTTISLNAQYKIPVQNTKDGKLTLNDFSGDLPIEGYSGTEIIITSDRGDKAPDR